MLRKGLTLVIKGGQRNVANKYKWSEMNQPWENKNNTLVDKFKKFECIQLIQYNFCINVLIRDFDNLTMVPDSWEMHSKTFRVNVWKVTSTI